MSFKVNPESGDKNEKKTAWRTNQQMKKRKLISRFTLKTGLF